MESSRDQQPTNNSLSTFAGRSLAAPVSDSRLQDGQGQVGSLLLQPLLRHVPAHQPAGGPRPPGHLSPLLGLGGAGLPAPPHLRLPGQGPAQPGVRPCSPASPRCSCLGRGTWWTWTPGPPPPTTPSTSSTSSSTPSPRSATRTCRAPA